MHIQRHRMAVGKTESLPKSGPKLSADKYGIAMCFTGMRLFHH